jgi:hypothetical protein
VGQVYGGRASRVSEDLARQPGAAVTPRRTLPGAARAVRRMERWAASVSARVRVGLERSSVQLSNSRLS